MGQIIIKSGSNRPKFGSGISLGGNSYNALPAAENFPISNAQLQWYLSPPSELDIPTNQTTFLSGKEFTVPTFGNVVVPSSGLNWYAGAQNPTGSFAIKALTNYYGTTNRYIEIGNNGLTTISECWDPSVIVSNGGYTFWRVEDVRGGRSGWSRFLWYAAPNSVSPGSTITHSAGNPAGTGNYQYGNITSFQNSDGNSQINQGFYNNTSTNSGYATTPAGVTYSNASSALHIYIVSVSNYNGVGSIRITQRTYSTSTNLESANVGNTWDFVGYSPTGTTTFSLQTGYTTNVRPWINDYIYQPNQNSTREIYQMGFANRPYDATDHSNLLNWITTKYFT